MLGIYVLFILTIGRTPSSSESISVSRSLSSNQKRSSILDSLEKGLL